jgi:dTDP-4-dehydrorhamnose 3,5-epimerase
LASAGQKDSQTVLAGGARAFAPRIIGVCIIEIGNILTRSGSMAEIFRRDWQGMDVAVQQVNWQQLNPGGVTDWHKHQRQTDRIVAVGGNIKLALWDDREGSASRGASDIVRIGALRPVMVIVPPGVWHGLRNESGEPAGYINVIDTLFEHAAPDNWRLTPGSKAAPDIL